MELDMRKFSRILECRNVPIEIPQPFVDMRVSGADIANVGLEMLNVDDVEANDGGVETNIRFGDVLAEVVRVCGLGKVFLDTVEGGEELSDGLIICLFRGGKSGSIDTIVDVVVCPVIGGLDILLKVFGIQDYIAVFLLDQIIELYAFLLSAPILLVSPTSHTNMR